MKKAKKPTKTMCVRISPDLHRKLNVFRIQNDVKFKELVEFSLKEVISNDDLKTKIISKIRGKR
jgi:predicted HicB family RNase H-like nuclease